MICDFGNAVSVDQGGAVNFALCSRYRELRTVGENAERHCTNVDLRIFCLQKLHSH